MSAIPVRANDGSSAQPGPRKRRARKPAKTRSPEQSIRLVVTPQGTFAPADSFSRKLCKDRRMSIGKEFIAYVYEPRDSVQWRKAHALGNYLVVNVEEFFGLDAHSALKKIQMDGNIACDVEKIDLGKLGVVSRTVPQSLAFGFIDESRFTEIYRQMCVHIGAAYLGEIDADQVEQMLQLMLSEPAA